MNCLRNFKNLLTISSISRPQFALFASDQAYEKCINQVTLLGRVGTEPTVRGTDQNPLITFSLATNSIIKETDDIRQKTDWHRIAVFRPYLRDNLANYLRKGQRVLVQGKISHSTYQDSKGVQQYSTTIIADDVIFMNSSEPRTKEDEQILQN